MTGNNATKRNFTASQVERLTQWAQKKPAIALMGEFSAGKSTLLNLLIGRSVLPTQITATQLPPVWMRYGEGEPYRMDIYGNRRAVDLTDITSIPVRKTRFIRVYSKAEFLKRCDLIDTPGISDPNIPAQVWMHAVGYANAILWCTHATQAWRESERSAWVNLPDRVKDKSLLLVTRSDKLATDADRQKVDARLEREAAPLFRSRHFMSLLDAIQAREAGDTGEAWEKSGGRSFMEALDGVITDTMAARGNMLLRYKSSGSNVQNFPGVVQPARPAREGGGMVQSFSPVRPARPIGKKATERRERLPAAEANDIRTQFGIDGSTQQPHQPSVAQPDAAIAKEDTIKKEVIQDKPAQGGQLNALVNALSEPRAKTEPEVSERAEGFEAGIKSAQEAADEAIEATKTSDTFAFVQPNQRSMPTPEIVKNDKHSEEAIPEVSEDKVETPNLAEKAPLGVVEEAPNVPAADGVAEENSVEPEPASNVTEIRNEEATVAEIRQEEVAVTETHQEETIPAEIHQEETAVTENLPEDAAPISSSPERIDVPTEGLEDSPELEEEKAVNLSAVDNVEDIQPPAAHLEEVASELDTPELVAEDNSSVEELTEPAEETAIEEDVAVEAVEEPAVAEQVEEEVVAEAEPEDEVQVDESVAYDEPIPSKIWAEIVARGDIETVPQVLEAIQELLDRVESDAPDFSDSEDEDASSDKAETSLPGGWSKLA